MREINTFSFSSRAIDLEVNFNISAPDLKLKPNEVPIYAHGMHRIRAAAAAKNAKTFAYSLHFYSPRSFYTQMRRDSADYTRTGHAVSHRRPDIISVGAYFRKWILWKQFLLF